MKIRKKYLTVSETTEDAFIALETENLNIPEWKLDYTIKALNEIMDRHRKMKYFLRNLIHH